MCFFFNKTPLTASKGLIIGPDHHKRVLQSLNIEPKTIDKKCCRVILITKTSFEGLENEKVATFVYPPMTFGNQTNAIRLI